MAGSVTIKFDEGSRIAISAKFLEGAAKRVSAAQREQVNQAFVRGGQPGEPWKPLKDISGKYKTKSGYAIRQSYRNGGRPLRNTGALKASFFSHIERKGRLKIVSEVGTPEKYAIYQQLGAKTKGPNFIPLTRKAVRLHVNGTNPKSEGLVQGKDYIMAWKGVTIPARPIIDYNNSENKAQIVRAAMKGA